MQKILAMNNEKRQEITSAVCIARVDVFFSQCSLLKIMTKLEFFENNL